MTRELLCAAASECCISAFEKVTPDLTFVVGPCPLRARPSHGTERPWTSYSAISPFSDSTSNGGCRFSGVWPRCTRFGSLDTGREIRDEARGNRSRMAGRSRAAAVSATRQFVNRSEGNIHRCCPPATTCTGEQDASAKFLRSLWRIVNPQTCRFGGRLPPGEDRAGRSAPRAQPRRFSWTPKAGPRSTCLSRT